jgi:hypothetical protein
MANKTSFNLDKLSISARNFYLSSAEILKSYSKWPICAIKTSRNQQMKYLPKLSSRKSLPENVRGNFPFQETNKATDA